MPDPGDPDHLAHLRVDGSAPAPVEPLTVRRGQTIRLRHSDRRPVTGTPAGPDDLAAITTAVEAEATWLHILRPEQILDLAAAADHAQRTEAADTAWQTELAYWTGGTRPTRSGIPDAAIPHHQPQTTAPGRDFGHQSGHPGMGGQERLRGVRAGTNPGLDRRGIPRQAVAATRLRRVVGVRGWCRRCDTTGPWPDRTGQDGRAGEAATLRVAVTDALAGHGDQPAVILTGDLNDTVQAATTQLLLGPPGSEIGTRGFTQPDHGDPTRMWNLAPLLPGGHDYSRINQGHTELIDHILGSKTLITPPDAVSAQASSTHH